MVDVSTAPAAVSRLTGLVVNAESLAPPRTGIGTYTAALIREYRRLLPGIPVHAFLGGVLLPADEALRICEDRVGTTTRRRERTLGLLYRVASKSHWPYRLHHARNRRAFARTTAKLPAGVVYHEPNFILKSFVGPRVVTVHDLSFRHYPEAHPAARVQWLERHLPDTLARADRIVTVSDFIRRELIEWFSADPERIRTVLPGVSTHFRAPPVDEVDRVLAAYGLARDRFVLCVSTLEPRKGLDTLMETWDTLPSAVRRDHRLVVAGSRGWHSEAIERRLTRLCDRGEAIRLGYVPERDLPALLAGCAVFAYPSIYEGFGLPVLEAMACGAAAVISDGTALAEIAGDAVRTAPPRSIDGLASAILALLDDASARAELGEAASAFAHRFSWRRAARQHIKVFDEAVQRRES